MSASPANPKKHRKHACRCCATWTKSKAAYCKPCQDAQCDEYPGDCGHAFVKPRYLAQQQGKLHPQQYTTNPSEGLSRESATIDAEALAEYAKEGQARSEALRSRDREALPLSSRVAELERQAEAGDAQARRQLFVIRQRVEAHERRAA